MTIVHVEPFLTPQGTVKFWQDSSIVRFVRIDHVVNGLNPLSAYFSLSVRRVPRSAQFLAH